jgi:hypothetical protein
MGKVDKLLVLDWRKRQQTRADVVLTIQNEFVQILCPPNVLRDIRNRL